MPFQKGHQINGNPSGLSREKRRQLMSLALDIRSAVPVEDIRTWLVTIWQTGKDPLTGDAVDIKFRKECLEILLNRGWGQAAQHVVVEADVRSHVIEQDAQPEVQLTFEEIQARRRALRDLGIRARVIDASSFERKELPAECVTPADDESEE